MKYNNVIVAQSGGPSSVINNTLRGIIDTCKNYPGRFGTIYGALHGVEGVLKEELINLSDQEEKEILLLSTTPAAGSIGTCRYKLRDHQDKDFNRIIEIFRAHSIGFFFYIGGNDSQHTAFRISEICTERSMNVVVVGVPKTIDNDIGDNSFKLIDHTPGYGSVARYWAMMIQNLNEENKGSSPSDPVMVVQAMGRKIGYIPAAARLGDPERRIPMQIYLAESGISLPEMADNINDYINKFRRCIVVVSEGYDTGDQAEAKDAFGHTQHGASSMSVQQKVVNYLNSTGLNTRGSARGQVPGTDQRNAMVYASTVDLDEAYTIGQKSVEIAIEDGTGWMSTILRKKGQAYKVIFDKVPLGKVALSERFFPNNWIAGSGWDVTDDFVNYAQPLIGLEWVKLPLEKGLQRFAQLKPIFENKKLPGYIPQAY